MYCTNCGMNLPASARFCGACGHQVESFDANARDKPVNGVVYRAQVRSIEAACVLEIILPGGGFMYLGSVGLGIAILSATLTAAVAAYEVYGGMVQQAIAACTSFGFLYTACQQDPTYPNQYFESGQGHFTNGYSDATHFLIGVIVMFGIWTVIRLYLIITQPRKRRFDYDAEQ